MHVIFRSLWSFAIGNYKQIREELRAALLRILERKGLIPKEILDLELGKYRIKVEKETGKDD